ncbi:aspartic peptidase domain-containing protein [Mycena capillaripes]|nr:aspartic peptidase domain-containing protein [Mycena capillaripes]
MGISGILSILSLLAAGALSLKAILARQLPPADFSIPIRAKVSRRESKKFANHRRKANPTVILDGAAFDYEYVGNISFGGQYFNLILDTGSANLWVVQEGFSCFDLNQTAVPASMCDFGPALFNPADSPRENMKGPRVRYRRDRESLGHSADNWHPKSCHLPRGFSQRRRFLYVLNGASVVPNSSYNPYTVFSISLDRSTFEQGKNDLFDADLGILAFGGIVPVPVLNTSVTVPIQRYSFSNDLAVPSNSTDAEFIWYTVEVDSFIFPGSRTVVTKSNNIGLDTGSTLLHLPTPIAAA